MSKKTVLIIIIVVVFLVIGVVIYLMMANNKKTTSTITDSTKTQTGISNLLANSGGFGGLTSLLTAFKGSNG